tara:strand:+ start:813 stop:1016 length:204 start_codon:yes stop_codon:yes gene_type:complete
MPKFTSNVLNFTTDEPKPVVQTHNKKRTHDGVVRSPPLTDARGTPPPPGFVSPRAVVAEGALQMNFS